VLSSLAHISQPRRSSSESVTGFRFMCGPETGSNQLTNQIIDFVHFNVIFERAQQLKNRCEGLKS